MHSVPSEPLRTLLVVPSIDPLGTLSAGGAERMTRNLCLAFERSRITPLLLTYVPHEGLAAELEAAGVRSFVLAKRARLDLRLLWRLRRLILGERIDAVLSMYQTVNLYNLLATPTVRGVACLIRVARVGLPRRILQTEGRLSHRADFLLFNSQAAARALEGKYSIPSERYRIIANGCDSQRFAFVPHKLRAEYRNALDLPADAFVLYTPNRIHANKGQDLLANALAGIPELLAQRNVVWVNTGVEQDKELARAIRATCAPLGDRVRLLPPTDEPEAWIAASDAVVIPSRTESFPNALLEAASVGRPSLVTACGAARQVAPELDALLVDPDSIEALTDGLRALLDLPAAELAARGASAAEVVRGRYSVATAASRYADVIEEAVVRRRSLRR
jgi:glycosyltransferase involved in cell wall biosynthesis